ncbi:DUF968 domain-containing protein [Vreelandella venusta]|uniref:DUF968 domain-containing protein n=1 Tax=Vreelandella venusta TaxID=44935 RepID=UPI00200FA6F1|nr:DUF968 domain-containing protein [Halomonas venusta]UQI42732.1 DUF968 domain-containing protein [Halomonas venusta]
MLKRKTPLRAKAPMARKPLAKRRKKAQSAKQKDVRWRSEPYLAFVRSLPCCNCQGPGCDPHHVIGLHWGLSGQGLTAPDSFAMPLCRACHDEVHRSPELQRMQPHWLRQTLRAGLSQFTGADAEQLLHALAFIEAKEAV